VNISLGSSANSHILKINQKSISSLNPEKAKVFFSSIIHHSSTQKRLKHQPFFLQIGISSIKASNDQSDIKIFVLALQFTSLSGSKVLHRPQSLSEAGL
jgi:hypothetical protein